MTAMVCWAAIERACADASAKGGAGAVGFTTVCLTCTYESVNNSKYPVPAAHSEHFP
jgi:hypothetical protein